MKRAKNKGDGSEGSKTETADLEGILRDRAAF
jgi:hypothetical protein